MINDISNNVILESIEEDILSINSNTITGIHTGNTDVLIKRKDILLSIIHTRNIYCTSHVWKSILIKEPTINENGYYKIECDNCMKAALSNVVSFAPSFSEMSKDYEGNDIEIFYYNIYCPSEISNESFNINTNTNVSLKILLDHINQNIVNNETQFIENQEFIVEGLPEGLTYDNSTGVISGKVIADNNYTGSDYIFFQGNLIVKYINNFCTISKIIPLKVTSVSLLAPPVFSDGIVELNTNVNNSYAIKIDHVTTNIINNETRYISNPVWEITIVNGSLPDTITISTNGIISGNVTANQNFTGNDDILYSATLYVNYSNNAGSTSGYVYLYIINRSLLSPPEIATDSLTWEISNIENPSLETYSLSNYQIMVDHVNQNIVNNETQYIKNTKWSITGSLPTTPNNPWNGPSFNTSNGKFSGYLFSNTYQPYTETYNVDITYSNNAGTSTRNIPIYVVYNGVPNSANIIRYWTDDSGLYYNGKVVTSGSPCISISDAYYKWCIIVPNGIVIGTPTISPYTDYEVYYNRSGNKNHEKIYYYIYTYVYGPYAPNYNTCYRFGCNNWKQYELEVQTSGKIDLTSNSVHTSSSRSSKSVTINFNTVFGNILSKSFTFYWYKPSSYAAIRAR